MSFGRKLGRQTSTVCGGNSGLIVFLAPKGGFKMLLKTLLKWARQLGFEELEKEDVDGFLKSHGEELSNEDLMHLVEQIVAEDVFGYHQKVPPKDLSAKRLSEIFQHINAATNIMQEDDPNVESNLNVARV